jgi:hypothetical protein
MEETKFYPLGDILEVVQSTGLDVSYAYDDLVFSEHNVFIVRFDGEDSRKIWLYFNKECQANRRSLIEDQITAASKRKGFKLQPGGLYELKPKENTEEIEINFLGQVSS